MIRYWFRDIMSHFLAVFGAEVARPPQGLERVPSGPHPRFPEAQEVEKHEKVCKEILESAYDGCKSATRQLKMPGKGCGFSFEASPYCSYAVRDGIHVLMSGEVAEWPGVDAVQSSHNAFVRNEEPAEEDDAHWLLDFYSTFTKPAADDMDEHGSAGSASEAVLSQALECLASLRGTFAFVIYDAVRHRVLAARDRDGICPLHWGATESGQLLFGSNLADLAATNPTATAFPSGCLFTSEHRMIAYSPGERGWQIPGDDVPGELLSFVAGADDSHFKGVRAIPRVTSKGMVCGAVYRVASAADVAKPMKQH